MVDLALERALHESLTAGSGTAPPRLAEAMSYAVFPGGGRVRPRLCLEVARACGVTASELAYAAACSVELLHCASLVHDDLPAFDAAATRRGKASVHRAYGEPMAVLVGDGLMVQAFYTLARTIGMNPELGARPVLALLEAAGPRSGLVAGQAWELEPKVDVGGYHRAKTASLFEAAAALGAMVGATPPSAFVAFGRAFGMAYQLADDVADAVSDPETLGKPTGRDRDLGRPTAMRADAGVDAGRAALIRAAQGVRDAVPPCPGAAGLRCFVDAVFAALLARCPASSVESVESVESAESVESVKAGAGKRRARLSA